MSGYPIRDARKRVDDAIRENAGKRSAAEIGALAGVHERSVKKRAEKLGLSLRVMSGSWGDERLVLAKKLFLEGSSAAAIAKELGGGLTRNAVIAKLHREKVSRPACIGRGIQIAAAREHQRKRREARAAARAKAATPKAPSATTPRAVPAPPQVKLFAVTGGRTYPQAEPRPMPADAPQAGPVYPLEQLDSHMCKWPIGDPRDPAFGFCGAKRSFQTGHLPYCGAHTRLAKPRNLCVPAKPSDRKRAQDLVRLARVV